MLHNKEIKRLIIIEALLLIISLILGVISYGYLERQFEKDVIRKNAQIISSIVEQNPELEEDVINAFLHNSGSYEEGMELLKKYNLDTVEGIGYLEDVQARRRGYYQIHIFMTLFIFVFFSISYLLFTKKQYKKIHEINQYMNHVLNGKETFDIRDYDEGTISCLKNDVYKITTMLKEQKELAHHDKLYLESTLSDISHQLRTPLTSMYVINDLLRDEKLSKERKREMLNKNHSQLERIEWLVTSLLKLSRLDSGMVLFKSEKVKMMPFLEEVVEPIRIPMELKNQTLRISCDSEITMDFDPDWTREALLNIIKNACEHTDLGGTIQIIVNDNLLYLEIEIIDNGCGISPEDLPHIFERFYKGKSDNKESIGIGLNLAKKIIEQQNGEIRVTSRLKEGTTFLIRFYKNII